MCKNVSDLPCFTDKINLCIADPVPDGPDVMRCTVLVIVILSVRLSVCPSATLVDCVHMVRPTTMISLLYGSPIILVSGDFTLIPKFEGGHPERGR